jgi:polyisoprenoid-binding protein YceI
MEQRELWHVDAARSRLTFVLHHLIVSEIRGHFGVWGGTLMLDREQPERSAVRAWVDMASVETGEPERDEHLRSEELLNVERFPRAHLHSTGVGAGGDGVATFRAELDLHGVIHPVDLSVELRGTRVDADGHRRAAYGVQGRFDRQTFGLHWNQDLDTGGFVVGDQVYVVADVELVLQRASTTRDRPTRDLPAR